jgi:hypothetical protein
MNIRLIRHFFFFSLVFISELSTISVHAELRIDDSNKSEKPQKIALPLIEKITEPYGQENSVVFPYEDKKALVYDLLDSNFWWTFNGNKYLSHINTFVSDLTPIDECKNVTNDNETFCKRVKERHYTCHLFMFKEDLSLDSVTPIKINSNREEIRGNSFCAEVKAISTAREIPDAMLITFNYLDSADIPSSPYSPDYFSITVLLKMKEENGKLKIEQDDSCLGNPNHYNTISKARQALKKCQTKQ